MPDVLSDDCVDENGDKLRQNKKWFRWIPTSMRWLIEAEEKMLSVVTCQLSKYYVRIFNNSAVLWTVTANKECKEKTTPLVMIHGFGSGVALWCLNYDGLSKHRTVYTFDLLGFGRSSRITFPKTTDEIEEKFVSSIEEWRQEQQLEKFHLLGHSFGGFIAGCYALKHPDRVKSVIFADPWGFPERSLDDTRYEIIRWGKSVHRVLTPLLPYSESKTPHPWVTIPHWLDDMVKALGPITPLSPIRAAGPLGPAMMKTFRQDYKERFSPVTDKYQDVVFEYLFHCNASKPSGEIAFKTINNHLGYNCVPMVLRLTKLNPGLPVTFIFGSRSWITADCGYKTKRNLPLNDVAVYVVEGAGHHVYVERRKEFNKIVNDRCQKFD